MSLGKYDTEKVIIFRGKPVRISIPTAALMVSRLENLDNHEDTKLLFHNWYELALGTELDIFVSASFGNRYDGKKFLTVKASVSSSKKKIAGEIEETPISLDEVGDVISNAIDRLLNEFKKLD